MILQALNRYYDILANDPNSTIAREGYCTTGVSFALLIAPDGELKSIISQMQPQQNGKKSVEVPRRMVVPEQVKRAGTNPLPNFLCDNCTYVLGLSERAETDPDYAIRRFKAFKDLHQRLLEGVNCPEAYAVLAFLRAYDPAQARQHPLIADKLEDLLHGGGNLIFMLEGGKGWVHEAPEIRRAWEASRAGTDKTVGQCLVTGEYTKIARLHPNIKGIRGAQPTGATLVGFNAPAYESYNRTKGQGLNAPTGEKAVFAYTTVLNYLLSRESGNPTFTIGDTTVVYWAESPIKAYAELFSTLFDPDLTTQAETAIRRDPQANQRLREIAQKVKSGEPLDTGHLMEGLDPKTRFFVLGLAPNAARVVVRFFYQDAFQEIVNHIMAHYDALSIERQFDNQPVRLSIRALLEETYSKKATDKTPPPLMAGALMRSILNGTPYPAALYYTIMNRIRADVDDSQKHIAKINYARAAVIKAYLTRKYHHQGHTQIKEVLCMALNEQSTHPAYLLGRLFAVLEKAQTDALGNNVNATIKDRYFTTACASPATVFPVLLRLSQHHISKAEYGYASDRRIEEILGLMQMNGAPIPKHLSLDEQGIFVLGYYHQRTALFKSKPDKDESTIPTHHESEEIK